MKKTFRYHYAVLATCMLSCASMALAQDVILNVSNGASTSDSLWGPSPGDLARPLFPPQEIPPWVHAVLRYTALAAETIYPHLSPDEHGFEHPNPDEAGPTDIIFRIAHSRFQFYLQGIGNLKLLGGPYLYEEMQGGAGFEYNFVSLDHPDTIVALRATPLYGEIALIRVADGAGAVANLPAVPILGTSLGLEASHQIGRVRVGLQAYIRPQWAIDGTGNGGVSIYSAVYCKVALGPNVSVEPIFAYYDRGQALQSVYDWPAQAYGADRSVGQIRGFWQAMVMLNIAAF